ncbi:MAG: DUF4097 family beta strand repeat protein [Lewinellaceae bacterium]|nr:DUF4097 family beta strand repeat protein [Saprospiraceae bacterium]MCB9340294.1 DUF4097 family beta strand repeat protein [Lewinellaceae bacterium]
MNTSLKFSLSAFCLLIGQVIFSQTPLQVVTKTIEKTFPYKNGNEVNIEGEKAEILVETWNRNEVKVLVELVSKHPDRKIAEADLAKMKYTNEQHGDKLYFRNYVSKDAQKPTSDLKAIYTITLPADCPVYLKNNFGLTNVSNLTNALRIQSEFSKINLDNLRGQIGINTRFGDIEGNRIDGLVSINARRSDITLHEIKGNWNINAQYGVLKFFTNPSPELLTMNIDAEKSDVYFFDPKPNFYGYSLTAHYGNISVPNDLKFNFLENTDQLKKAIFSSKIGSSNISIKISFGDITIRNP